MSALTEISPFYRVGTATQAGTAVTGQGTAWIGNAEPGDVFINRAGQLFEIASVNSDTSITLVNTGHTVTAQTAVAYTILRMSDTVRAEVFSQRLVNLVAKTTLASLGNLDGLGGDKGVMLSGAGAAATFALTAFARSLLDDADLAQVFATLGLTAGFVGATSVAPSAAGNGMADGDFDTITAQGVYTTTGTWANGPLGNPAAHTGVLMVPKRSFGQVVQIWLSLTNQFYWRGGNTGAWNQVVPNALANSSATARLLGRATSGAGAVEQLTAAQVWAMLGVAPVGNIPDLLPDKAFRRGNILGTVSQASGVPTGSLVEKGSNANGEYVRLADGTQICWNNSIPGAATDLGNGSIYRSNTYTWTFPVAFISGSNAVSACSRSIGIWTDSQTPSTASVGLRNYCAGSIATATDAMAMAIGRWF